MKHIIMTILYLSFGAMVGAVATIVGIILVDLLSR